MAAARRRRWFGFLYAILGTQGSFFAWVIALFGIYVTWQEALLWAVNRVPHATTVAEIMRHEPRWRRWVEVGGVEMDLGSALFAATGQPTGVTDRILIDRDDPVAVAWRELFRKMRAIGGDLEAGTAEADARLIELHRLLIEIGAPGTRDRY